MLYPTCALPYVCLFLPLSLPLCYFMSLFFYFLAYSTYMIESYSWKCHEELLTWLGKLTRLLISVWQGWMLQSDNAFEMCTCLFLESRRRWLRKLSATMSLQQEGLGSWLALQDAVLGQDPVLYLRLCSHLWRWPRGDERLSWRFE